MNTDQEIRYSRNITLKEISKNGQEKLLKSSVLVIGAGGLGSPLLLYLAASGIGNIGVIDDDKVDLSNLQRQIIHETSDIGCLKTESALESIYDLNPEINVEIFSEKLAEENISQIIRKYDVVADGSDNFETRFLVNDICYKEKKILVSAAIGGFSGQLYVFKAFADDKFPCYRCLYSDIPPLGTAPKCSESGVLGSVAGTMGTWQATEIIKEILDIGESLAGYFIIFDALTSESRKVKIKPDPKCKCCGISPNK